MKNIIISGGTDGLGLEMTKLLAETADNHIFVLGRNPDKLSNIGDNVSFIKIDITREKEVEAFEKSFEQAIDLLIISVGIFGHGPLGSFSYDQMRQSIETNLLGHIFLTKSLVSTIKDGGRIVSINSMSGVNATKERSLLCAAKWGLRGFYNSLSEELKPRKVMISQIFPGYFDSGYMDKVGIPKDKTYAISKEVLAKQIIAICDLPPGVYAPELQIKNISYS